MTAAAPGGDVRGFYEAIGVELPRVGAHRGAGPVLRGP